MKAGLRRLYLSENELLVEVKHSQIDDRAGKANGSELDEAMPKDPLHKGNLPNPVLYGRRFAHLIPLIHDSFQAMNRLSPGPHSA